MHAYFHTVLGFCLWDLLALLVLAAAVILLAVHIVRERRRERELEEELSERMAQNQPRYPVHHAGDRVDPDLPQ